MRFDSPKSKSSEGNRRVLRVEKELREVIARYLMTIYRGEELQFVSIERIHMPADLRSAKVFVSSFGAESSIAAEALQARASEIQRHVSRELPLRYCPRLQFLPDRSTEKILKVEQILNDLKTQQPSS